MSEIIWQFIFLGIILLEACIVVTHDSTNKAWQKEAIEKGFAVWEVNQSTGETKFSWKREVKP